MNRKITEETVSQQILLIRGHKVILDVDLARIYGVTTKRLNEQARRNMARFPPDFLFQLNAEEVSRLNWSQNASNSGKRRGRPYFPFAFTEHGAIMAATILNSPKAVQMSVFVVRAFVKMRAVLSGQKELAEKLVELELKLTERLDVHETAIVEVLKRIMELLDQPAPPEPPPKRPIGFHV